MNGFWKHHAQHVQASQTRSCFPGYARFAVRSRILIAAFLAVGLLTGISIDYQDNDFSFCDAAGIAVVRAASGKAPISLPPLNPSLQPVARGIYDASLDTPCPHFAIAHLSPHLRC